MPRITLFEHQHQSYLELGLSPDHPGFEQIERLDNAHSAEMRRVGRHHLGATQFVGVWRVGDLIGRVLPKIDYGLEWDLEPGPNTPGYHQAVGSATHNLLRKLAYAGEFPVAEQDIAPLETTPHDWLELLTRLLAAGLHRQLQFGLERQYVRQEDDLPVIRGRWMIQQQLARRPHVRHRFDVAYDEFREDTPLNQVFLYTVEKLLPRTRENGTRQLLGDIREWLREAALLPLFILHHGDFEHGDTGHKGSLLFSFHEFEIEQKGLGPASHVRRPALPAAAEPGHTTLRIFNQQSRLASTWDMRLCRLINPGRGAGD